jgi:hypothetical protein
MTVSIRHADPYDALVIANNLREEDKRGMEMLGVNCEVELAEEILNSNCAFTGIVDGEIAIVWGITTPTLLSGSGYIWAVTTNAVDKCSFVFARRSRLEIEAALERVPLLSGLCFAYNKRSLRWLNWLKADIGALTHFKDVPAYPFVFRRS